ncbi:hypothetical protein LEMA_P047190.1 [Plenodomus lingam JN3]|uniref:Mannosyl-oligosaccharide glucosidase n=1 Tax=Leptosphaeria maculans (strain JN3 / isolate v23.1.3 / race Av1-4-5-6-7-8) TaxID=985895 RepID=E5R543_LEPMJ|nr:hypothetical protein LEMA_P047190.1 [Plenodomus lingam JN3]CBX92013.1 hypothetical protein LEMA_P047190.1 [Plenodomus lingam JN3]
MPAELTRSLESATDSFHQDFARVFNPRKPFKTDQHVEFSKTVLSNLLAGLGYFHGTTKVDTSNYAETTAKFWEVAEEASKHAVPETRGPYELTSFTPSRSVFPRGFWGDEGFHLLPVMEWDVDLALEVLQNWLALMDEDGWIANEQVLGEEAEGTTPESLIQYPHLASPPTMFLAVDKFVDMLEGTTEYHGRKSLYLRNPETGTALLADLYVKLQKHYQWFRTSQSGDVEIHSIPSANLDEGYRWRGRTPETNVASGLDDFPRPEPPDVTELHLDALCWVGVMARTLQRIATLHPSTASDLPTYQTQLRNILKNIDALHWDAQNQVYCDAVVRNDKHTLTPTTRT